ncbi:hypothetical protein CNR22_13720 [Sphingobacteriaceae bacterium]|nr:hypothetical protein CNR22_13720 [Sphingobacteriaceae bacterium]
MTTENHTQLASMCTKIKLSVIVLLVFNFNAVAQKELFKFRVLDTKTNEPIEFCYVVVKGKNSSAQSDENGLVKIAAQHSDTLVVYQMGYFIKKIIVEEVEAYGNRVHLRPKNITLEEVIVKSSRTDTFQKNTTIFFLDFEFYDDMILALVNKGTKYNTLMLMNQQGDKITEKQLSLKAEVLFKDCFQAIQLITNDSIYQVYFDYQKLDLLKPYPIKNYYAVLKPCECTYRNSFVLKSKKYRALKNTYYLFDEQRKSQLPQEIITIADSVAIKGFNMDYDLQYFLGIRKAGYQYQTSVTEIKKHLDLLREELILPSKYESMLPPIASEMKRLDSNYVLFDYTNKHLRTFSLNGKLKSKTDLTNFSGITPHLYVDHDTHNLVFSRLNSAGILTLYRYDLTKNTFTHSFELKDFYFVKDFQVKENNLYFIHKNRSESMTSTKIIKQLISWQSMTNTY